MSNRIEQKFKQLSGQGRKALIPFITAGDPGMDSTVPIMHALVAAGADLLELGVPFSDPMADGPVIQAASERAIARGMNLDRVLKCVRTFRHQDQETPVILMGYMNPVERFGYERLAQEAESAGVDGLLLVDCPPEESGLLQQQLSEQGLRQIFLVAPTTTEERIAAIGKQAQGFIYYVALKGVTGADMGGAARTSMQQAIENIRRHSSLPVAAGFGIKDPQSAAAAARQADAVVVGSALVAVLSAQEQQAAQLEAVKKFIEPLRRAIDNTTHSDATESATYVN